MKKRSTLLLIYEAFKESKINEKRFLGRKKSSIEMNNFLLYPIEGYLEYLEKLYDLKQEHLTILKKMANDVSKYIEQYINELSLDIRVEKDSEIDSVFTDILIAFFTNKFLDDWLKRMFSNQNNLNLWIDSWIRNEFVMLSFLSDIMQERENKTIQMIFNNFRQQPKKENRKPIKHKISEEEIWISKIKDAKEKLIKLNPPKKISVSAVSRELGYRPKQRQSFVDKMVSLKLVNRNSVKKDFDKI